MTTSHCRLRSWPHQTSTPVCRHSENSRCSITAAHCVVTIMCCHAPTNLLPAVLLRFAGPQQDACPPALPCAASYSEQIPTTQLKQGAMSDWDVLLYQVTVKVRASSFTYRHKNKVSCLLADLTWLHLYNSIYGDWLFLACWPLKELYNTFTHWQRSRGSNQDPSVYGTTRSTSWVTALHPPNIMIWVNTVFWLAISRLLELPHRFKLLPNP